MTERKPALRNLDLPGRFDCFACGMNVEPKEYHPYFFCVMWKAGLDPRTVSRYELTRWLDVIDGMSWR